MGSLQQFLHPPQLAMASYLPLLAVASMLIVACQPMPITTAVPTTTTGALTDEFLIYFIRHVAEAQVSEVETTKLVDFMVNMVSDHWEHPTFDSIKDGEKTKEELLATLRRNYMRADTDGN